MRSFLILDGDNCTFEECLVVFGLVVVSTPAVGLAGATVLYENGVWGRVAHGTSVFLLKL